MNALKSTTSPRPSPPSDGGEGVKRGDRFTLTAINGIAELDVTLDGPGVYVARGPNGAGKTSAIEALKAASGDKSAKAEPSDGAREGTVRCASQGGGVLLSVGAKRKASGHPAVSLVSTGAIGTLIDPGLKDADLAARARLKALLELLPMPADADAIAELTARDATLEAEFGAWLAKEGRPVDALELAEMVRRRANDLALTAEKTRDEASGTVNELAQLIEGLGELDMEAGDLAEAERVMSNAEREALRDEDSAKARAELEKQQAEIRASLGERPDVEPVKLQIENCKLRIANLEKELAQERERMRGQVNELVQAEAAQKRYDQQSEILKRPITGATAEEAAASREVAQAAKAKAGRARVLDTALNYNARKKVAERTKAEATDAAKTLRGIAQGTADALGRLLARRGVPGLTIHEGRLKLLTGEGAVKVAKDFDTRLSFGERVRSALEIALAGYEPEAANAERGTRNLPVLALEPHFWLALDPARKAEVNAIARERGVCLVTEEPGEGELRVEKMGERRRPGPPGRLATETRKPGSLE